MVSGVRRWKVFHQREVGVVDLGERRQVLQVPGSSVQRSEKSISKLLEEILVLLRHVSPVRQPQGGRLPVGSSGRLGKWPLRDCEILRSSRCGEYHIKI